VQLGDELWAASWKAGFLCSGGVPLDVRPLAGGPRCVVGAETGDVAGPNTTGMSSAAGVVQCPVHETSWPGSQV
jgi:hypothetical protein